MEGKLTELTPFIPPVLDSPRIPAYNLTSHALIFYNAQLIYKKKSNVNKTWKEVSRSTSAVFTTNCLHVWHVLGAWCFGTGTGNLPFR